MRSLRLLNLILKISPIALLGFFQILFAQTPAGGGTCGPPAASTATPTQVAFPCVNTNPLTAFQCNTTAPDTVTNTVTNSVNRLIATKFFYFYSGEIDADLFGPWSTATASTASAPSGPPLPKPICNLAANETTSENPANYPLPTPPPPTPAPCATKARTCWSRRRPTGGPETSCTCACTRRTTAKRRRPSCRTPWPWPRWTLKSLT